MAEGVGVASATGAGVASAGAAESIVVVSLAGAASLSGAGSLAGFSLLAGAGSLAGAAVSTGAEASSASVLVGSSASTIKTLSVRLKTLLICDHFIKTLPPWSIACGSHRVSVYIYFATIPYYRYRALHDCCFYHFLYICFTAVIVCFGVV